VLNRKTVSIPTEATLDMKALHGPVSGNNILDGGGKKMSVVRQAGRERRTIVEIVSRATFRQFYL
jgi:hypothetical protein